MTNSTGSVLPADAESAMCLMLMQLLNPLIDFPKQCSVETVPMDGATMFVVCVAPEDMEKFIGQNTRTGKSLQVIVGAVGAKSQRRFSLTFRDDAATSGSNASLIPTITST